MNIEKLIDILIIFSKRKQELSPLRINKLLYFVDKYHLRKYGRFVLGDRYNRLPYGPVPSYTYNLINDFLTPFSVKGRSGNPLAAYFSKDQRGRHGILKLKKERPPDHLSESEIEIIDKVLEQYGGSVTSRLVDISHSEKTYKETPGTGEIEISLFLDGLSAPKKEFILGLVEIDRENICLNKSLNK